MIQSSGNFRWEEMAEDSLMAERGLFLKRLRVIKAEHDWGRGLAPVFAAQHARIL